MMFTRAWAMPNANTFSIKPIGDMVARYLTGAKVSVDPFARNSALATHTNDLDPSTLAESHKDAEEFILDLYKSGVVADVVLFDPPYSPRQISECYRGIGLAVGMEETQSGRMYRRVRDAIVKICHRDTVVLSCGWSSVGMGKTRGFEIEEILLCCHGGAHNDTICVAERMVAVGNAGFFDDSRDNPEHGQ